MGLLGLGKLAELCSHLVVVFYPFLFQKFLYGRFLGLLNLLFPSLGLRGLFGVVLPYQLLDDIKGSTEVLILAAEELVSLAGCLGEDAFNLIECEVGQ